MIDPASASDQSAFRHRHRHLPTATQLAVSQLTPTPMSTALFQVHNRFRKRAGFKANTSETSNDGDRILDEQGTANRALEISGLSTSLIRIQQNRMNLLKIFGTIW
jgi:hypothetical protein